MPLHGTCNTRTYVYVAHSGQFWSFRREIKIAEINTPNFSCRKKSEVPEKLAEKRAEGNWTASWWYVSQVSQFLDSAILLNYGFPDFLELWRIILYNVQHTSC